MYMVTPPALELYCMYNKPAFQATDEDEGEEKEGGPDQTKTVQGVALI